MGRHCAGISGGGTWVSGFGSAGGRRGPRRGWPDPAPRTHSPTFAYVGLVVGAFVSLDRAKAKPPWQCVTFPWAGPSVGHSLTLRNLPSKGLGVVR